MPNRMFLNLPKEKQDSFLNSAFDELSKVPLEKLSISKLSNDTHIGRTAFYYYFENKEDLYGYMLDLVKDDMISLALDAQERSANLFSFYSCVLANFLECERFSRHSGFLKMVILSIKNSDVGAMFESMSTAVSDTFNGILHDYFTKLDIKERFAAYEEELCKLCSSAFLVQIHAIAEGNIASEAACESLKKQLEIIEAGVVNNK